MMGDVTLRVNFAGDRLVFEGSVSGRRYSYVTKEEDGRTEVDPRDVDALISMKKRKGNCGCSKNGTGQGYDYNLFELP